MTAMSHMTLWIRRAKAHHNLLKNELYMQKTPFLATWALLFLHLGFTVGTENINFIED